MNRSKVVAHEKNRPSFSRHFAHLAQAFSLERRITHGKNLIDKQDVRFEVSRNGGAPSTIAGYEHLGALTLPADSYTSGDEVVVTATISDGVDMHLEPACDPGCPTGCPQAARWTVDYR